MDRRKFMKMGGAAVVVPFALKGDITPEVAKEVEVESITDWVQIPIKTEYAFTGMSLKDNQIMLIKERTANAKKLMGES